MIIATDGLCLPLFALLLKSGVGRNCAVLPFLWRSPYVARLLIQREIGGVTNIPHFWKQGNIRAHYLRMTAVFFAFREICRLIIATGSHLEKGNCYVHSNSFCYSGMINLFYMTL